MPLGMRFPAKLSSVLFVLATGCAYRTRPPADVPVERPVTAEAVTVRTDDVETATNVRKEALEVLAAAPGHGRSAHAFESVVTLLDRHDCWDAIRVDGMAALPLVLVPFGMVMEREKLRVDVAFTDHGTRYEGYGVADEEGGMYARARKKALARAYERAFAHAHPKEAP